MERLVIDIPEDKSTLVKQILSGLGVTIQQDNHLSQYKQKLASVSTWTDEDLKVFEESKKALNNFKPEQW